MRVSQYGLTLRHDLAAELRWWQTDLEQIGGVFLHRDRRQSQTAVLGSTDSEEPLMLPLEAIDLDAFRHRHEHHTFRCGLLLDGCGGQQEWG
ncbi:hypothetical protein GCM10010449_06030 [Streptomyces rectiviolaceus]|uniref:Uncharacterized protein n=1 Tax=Streptomyces rectiviolaceus TaxID=332591 RepID=A0ABP6M8Y0_9ACTN